MMCLRPTSPSPGCIPVNRRHSNCSAMASKSVRARSTV
jgi:hypothetical protein